MKKVCFLVSVFLFFNGLFSVNAQDLIVMRDGNMIEAKVMEIYPTEIRYKRIDNLNGPTIVIPVELVLSIKYENGLIEIINTSPPVNTTPVISAAPPAANERVQTTTTVPNSRRQNGISEPMQSILNALPAIPIAGNNLKFHFNNDKWTASVNGENFSAGTIERDDTYDGCILTLKQTHIWPTTAGKTAGRVADRIPGGRHVRNVLNTVGNIAGAAGPIEMTGPEIVLEYKAGPPPLLTLVK